MPRWILKTTWSGMLWRSIVLTTVKIVVKGHWWHIFSSLWSAVDLRIVFWMCVTRGALTSPKFNNDRWCDLSLENWRVGLLPNRRKLIPNINALKRIKAVGLGGFPAELLITVPAVSAHLLLSLVRKFSQSETFPRKWKNESSLRLQRRAPVLNVTTGGVFTGFLPSQR